MIPIEQAQQLLEENQTRMRQMIEENQAKMRAKIMEEVRKEFMSTYGTHPVASSQPTTSGFTTSQDGPVH